MKKLILFIIVLIIVGAGAFWGGMKYQQNKISSQRTFFQNLSPEERQQRLQELGTNFGGFHLGPGSSQRGGSGFIVGEIIAKDDKSVTVKLQNGGSKIVFLSNSTEITKSAAGTLSDLEIGKSVIVNGTANSDGSITAQTIQLRSK